MTIDPTQQESKSKTVSMAPNQIALESSARISGVGSEPSPLVRSVNLVTERIVDLGAMVLAAYLAIHGKCTGVEAFVFVCIVVLPANVLMHIAKTLALRTSTRVGITTAMVGVSTTIMQAKLISAPVIGVAGLVVSCT